MENQKIKKLLDNTPNKQSKFRTKIMLKEMMTHVKHTTPIVKLNLKLQYKS